MTQGPDDDLRALRRMLPVPAERDFPPGRGHQREEHLMTSLLQTGESATANEPAGGGRPPRRFRRRGLALAGTVAMVGALTVGVTLAMPGTGPAPTPAAAAVATPKLLTYVQDAPAQDAPEILNGLADTAARQPDTAVAGTEHLKTRGWYLNSSVKDGKTTSAVVPTERETWTAPDGSAHSVRRAGAPEFPTTKALDHWKKQGWSTKPGRPEVSDTPAGADSRMWKDRPPTDPEALKTWLEQGHPADNGPAETLVAITDLVGERVLSAPERAAVLRVLATVPGLQYEGTTTDRAGRTGKAFSLDSDHGGLPNRKTLIVDPADGRIVDDEETLTESAGRLGVPIPSVISYTVYLEADTRPAPKR
ncbi:hypothetical protein GCM10023194_10340 [Planotetraspora phitsanulokensis]|uniref:CU044_5270 family protein n=1 Tax=Planotetraspora phitsanulokensis TaxID=575192 RepID=A0A8J3XI86_9ACTN|nr:CU044_5270 family protein [Planotetraspora phitsanulokensis]GII40641.1 hypothetical protein Pph01_56440 [Planotetraspora phitsanulokensis]